MKLEQKGDKGPFLGRNRQREEEKREREKRGSIFSLRSTEIDLSISDEPRFKVGVLDESYAWIPETPSFAKVRAEGSRS